jgi:hypothetical protein
MECRSDRGAPDSRRGLQTCRPGPMSRHGAIPGCGKARSTRQYVDLRRDARSLAGVTSSWIDARKVRIEIDETPIH